MTFSLTVREEAEQLLARYAELIDAGDFAGVGRLLADAVVYAPDGGAIATGAAEVERLYEVTTRVHDDSTLRTQHLISNVIVTPQGSTEPGTDRFEVRSRFTVLQATDGVPLQTIVAGRYLDVMERRDGEPLRFISRTMVPVLWGDVSDHLTFTP